MLLKWSVQPRVRAFLVTARSELRKVLFLALSVTFLFAYEISRETLNGFASNSHRRRIWSLVRTSLKVKVNFGCLRAVYIWKNIFVLLITAFTEIVKTGSNAVKVGRH